MLLAWDMRVRWDDVRKNENGMVLNELNWDDAVKERIYDALMQ